MAQPIGMQACLISLVSPYSVENGATNRNTDVFNFYTLLKLALSFHILLKMARPIGAKGVFRFYSQLKLAFSLSLSEVYQNTEIIEVNCIHYVIRMQSFSLTIFALLCHNVY